MNKLYRKFLVFILSKNNFKTNNNLLASSGYWVVSILTYFLLDEILNETFPSYLE